MTEKKNLNNNYVPLKMDIESDSINPYSLAAFLFRYKHVEAIDRPSALIK